MATASHSRILPLVVAATAFLVSCGPKLARLDTERVASMSVSLVDGDGSFCSLESPQLRAAVMYSDGTSLSTWAGEKATGALSFADFLFSPTLGYITHNGYLRLPADQLEWLDRPVTVNAALISRPTIKAQMTVAPRYDCGGTIELGGPPGSDGALGADGKTAKTVPTSRWPSRMSRPNTMAVWYSRECGSHKRMERRGTW